MQEAKKVLVGNKIFLHFLNVDYGYTNGPNLAMLYETDNYFLCRKRAYYLKKGGQSIYIPACFILFRREISGVNHADGIQKFAYNQHDQFRVLKNAIEETKKHQISRNGEEELLIEE